MGIFRHRDRESMDPEELLAQGHADMAVSSAVPAEHESGAYVDRVPAHRGGRLHDQGSRDRADRRHRDGVDPVGWPVRVERDGQVIAQTVVEGIEQFRKTTDVAHAGANVGLLVPALDDTIVQSGDVISG